MWKCKNPECGKTFPIPARKTEERHPMPGDNPNVTRTMLDKAVCPHCESPNIEEVRNP
jgi:hypothetical protein